MADGVRVFGDCGGEGVSSVAATEGEAEADAGVSVSGVRVCAASGAAVSAADGVHELLCEAQWGAV